MKLMTTAALAAFALVGAVAASAQATGQKPDYTPVVAPGALTAAAPAPAPTPPPVAAAAPALAPAACTNDAGVAPVVDPNAKPKVIKPQVEAFLAWQVKRRAELQCAVDAINAKQAALTTDHTQLKADIATLNGKSEDERRKPEAFAEAEKLKQRDRDIQTRNTALQQEFAAISTASAAFKKDQDTYVAAVAAIDARYAPKKKDTAKPKVAPPPQLSPSNY
ncbi:MAG: hypothetical protein ACOYJ6_10855 [Caulobacterales bacterium]